MGVYEGAQEVLAPPHYRHAGGERKKFWLLPIIVTLVLLESLIVLTQGSAVAPFIYTLF